MKNSQITALLSVLWYIASTQSEDWTAVACMALFVVFGVQAAAYTFLERSAK